MNTINFTQTGGFPLDQNVLGFMQAQSQLAQQPANFGGQLCIISGCVVTGANVSAGFVAINGEVLPFNGGTISPKVIIVETATVFMYEDGSAKPVQKTRYATFGDDGVQNNLWVNFKRNTTEGVLARLERLERMAAPILTGNGWVLFNKPANEIPPFWAEVVEMRGRMPIGLDETDTDFENIGMSYGSKTFTLGMNNIPEHSHTYSRSQVGVGGEIIDANSQSSGGWSLWGHNKSTSKAGREFPDAIQLLNPYRIVLYIKYIGN